MDLKDDLKESLESINLFEYGTIQQSIPSHLALGDYQSSSDHES
jgi:hypothetical protein